MFRSGFLVIALATWATAVAAQLPRVELSAGIHRIVAEVAATDAEREKGLMHRRQMPANDGMLFVFDRSERYCMWMRDTYLPLSVAFIDAGGSIVNIEDMKPQTDDSHCASRPVRYALEMNLGWFAQRGLRPGSRVNGLERAPTGR